MAPLSSTLAWRIPWTEEPGRLQSTGSPRVGHDWVTSLSLSCIGEGNGNPLQCSCLENPRNRGAWWAAVSGVAQSRTRLKQLSSSSSNRGKTRASQVAQWWRICLPMQEPQETRVSRFNPRIRRSPGVGNGNPLQYSSQDNPMQPSGLQSMGSLRVGCKTRTVFFFLPYYLPNAESDSQMQFTTEWSRVHIRDLLHLFNLISTCQLDAN